MKPALEVRELSKRHQIKGPAVLEGVSLDVAPGEVAVVVGPSGVGKSTLLRCIAGLMRFDTGWVQLGSRRATAEKPEALLGAVGIVFQGFELFPHLSVRANCLLAPVVVRKESAAGARARIDGLLEQLHIAELGDAFPATLSGGQQQRVAIARALAMAPVALLWDEPTSALDPALRASVTALVRSVAESGIPQLVVTHDEKVAEKVATRIYRFENGRLAG
jgi:ABC-type polar amino acid transport system ATPase subunit